MSTLAGSPGRDRSRALFEEAQGLMPGGVSSPVRAFGQVGGDPVFFARGAGSRLYDVDGNAYLDYVGSWGPLIAGHAHPEIVAALSQAAERGSSFGAPTASEVELAKLVVERVPSVEKVRFVNSGTEATMSALRLARGVTGRAKVIKTEGGYHGHVDALLVSAGSGVLTYSLPGSAGVTPGTAADTVVVPYNDLGAVEAALTANAGQVAAVIMEPVAANMGVVPPGSGYLAGLKELTHQAGALLIFDEVVTGFRVATGGAQQRYGVLPDLTCLGKVLGGGLPVGAYGGRAELMNQLAPAGPVYQAGTLSGNPLAMAAGLATLKLLNDQAYARLEESGGRLQSGLIELARSSGVPLQVNRVGSMFTAFFTPDAVSDAATAKRSDSAAYARFFRRSLGGLVYLPPSQFEACFVSLAHSQSDLDKTLDTWEQAFLQLV